MEKVATAADPDTACLCVVEIGAMTKDPNGAVARRNADDVVVGTNALVVGIRASSTTSITRKVVTDDATNVGTLLHPRLVFGNVIL